MRDCFVPASLLTITPLYLFVKKPQKKSARLLLPPAFLTYPRQRTRLNYGMRSNTRLEPAMKLAVFEIEEWEREAFERLAQGQDIRFLSEPLTAENAELYSDADIVSTFIYSELGRMIRSQSSETSSS